VVDRRAGGRRTVPGAEFFVDYLTTALDEGRGARRDPGAQARRQWGVRYEKFNRVAQAWSIVAVAAVVRREDGHIAEARIGLTNMGSTPLRASAVEAALAGADASPEAIAAAARSAAEGDVPQQRPQRPGRLPRAPGAGAHSPGGDRRGGAVASIHRPPEPARTHRPARPRPGADRPSPRSPGGSTVQLENSFTVPVPIDEAWRVLLDIERIAPCMPGAALDSVTGDDFTGRVKVKLGPINLTYQGKASFVEKDEAAHRAVIDARGKDQRGNGRRPPRSPRSSSARVRAPGSTSSPTSTSPAGPRSSAAGS
jgi:hypothetical protein